MKQSNRRKGLINIYNPLFTDDDLAIYTSLDVSLLLERSFALSTGHPIKLFKRVFIGHIEYESLFTEISNSDTGITSQVSILFRIIYNNDSSINMIEVIYLLYNNINEGDITTIKQWKVKPEEQIEESEEDLKIRNAKERQIFHGEIEYFPLITKDLFFNQQLPNFFVKQFKDPDNNLYLT